MRSSPLPAFVDLGVIPLLNLATALLLSGVVVLMVGEDPVRALELLVRGAFGHGEAIGYTFYYATSYVFAGLAVALAFHTGLFNIGGEGQAYLGGLGATLVALGLAGLPAILVLPLAILGAAAMGGLWGLVPGWLQARRGSHVVITTILLNFVAASLMTYLLVNLLIRPGQSAPETAVFASGAWVPQLHEVLAPLGIVVARSPLNLSALLALLCCGALWVLLWRTRFGYELRVVGRNERAAVYGGIDPARVTILVMTLSGALAGLMAVNIILGAQHRLLINFVGGAGFVGIAVALMGRNHPVGIVLSAVLFGALAQGGSELSFDMPRVSRDLVTVVQGLVILFTGALEHLFRAPLERAVLARRARAHAAPAGG